MNTKQKCIRHLRKGDVIVPPARPSQNKPWVVFSVEPHDSLHGYLSLRFTYEEPEPLDDGKGGYRMVPKVTNAMAFDDRENFEVVA